MASTSRKSRYRWCRQPTIVVAGMGRSERQDFDPKPVCHRRVSATGVHGANRHSFHFHWRLVWGVKATEDILRSLAGQVSVISKIPPWKYPYPQEKLDPALVWQDLVTIKYIMWNCWHHPYRKKVGTRQGGPGLSASPNYQVLPADRDRQPDHQPQGQRSGSHTDRGSRLAEPGDTRGAHYIVSDKG